MTIREIKPHENRLRDLAFEDAHDDHWCAEMGRYNRWRVDYPATDISVDFMTDRNLFGAQEQLRDYKTTVDIKDPVHGYRAMTQACVYEKMLEKGSGLRIVRRTATSIFAPATRENSADVRRFAENIAGIKRDFAAIYGHARGAAVEKTIAEQFAPA